MASSDTQVRRNRARIGLQPSEASAVSQYLDVAVDLAAMVLIVRDALDLLEQNERKHGNPRLVREAQTILSEALASVNGE